MWFYIRLIEGERENEIKEKKSKKRVREIGKRCIGFWVENVEN